MPTMPILEVAVLHVRAGESARFEEAFRIAEPIICTSAGYLSHELLRCVEVEGKYLLLVRWRTLEEHTVGFRGSPQYQDWKRLLHHFMIPSRPSSTLSNCSVSASNQLGAARGR